MQMNAPDFVPVRKIGISSRSIVGTMPDGAKYESALERDLMELLRFDKNVRLYTPQPLTISYKDPSGTIRHYTPDGFIEYRRDSDPAREMSHVLCEVKYRADFRANWRDLLPRFRAAKQYAVDQGWEFAVLTEKEIRTPYLQNARFLWTYRSGDGLDMALVQDLIVRLADMHEADPEILMSTMFRDKWNRAAALPALWYLISNFQIGCDLERPLGMKSRIWSLEN